MFGDTKTSKDRMKKGASKSKAIEKAKKGVTIERKNKEVEYTVSDHKGRVLKSGKVNS